jgi:hypothetical protein
MRILQRVRIRSYRFALAAFGVLALAAPATLTGSASAAKATDGTLSVQGARGVIQIAARGTIIGRVDQGIVKVVDRNPFDSATPVVRGGKCRPCNPKTIVRRGNNIRFRLAGGFFRLRVEGVAINLDAVGRGSVTLNGDERYADTGVYSLNGGDFVPVPYERVSLQLAGPSVSGG